ncbi:MAG: MFS transporter [Candidatus Omnitrophota bacterium]
MAKTKLDKNIFSLGLVSFFTDISSEMIYPLLPIFLSSVLGVSTSFIGLVEGIAESTASILKVFSGWISDKFKKRKPIILLGYSLSTIGKPLLFLATNGWHVLAVRFVDRMGKGIRTSPRDALVADSSLPEERGRAFGIQRALDSLGAFVGPLLAFIILPLINNNLRFFFLLAFFPALIAVGIIIFFVKEKRSDFSEAKSFRLSLSALKGDFRTFVLIIGIFTLGNSSDAFLILRARDLGVSVVLIPVLWLVFNLVGSIASVPLGSLSDKIGRKKTTILGFSIYAVVYLGFALAKTSGVVWVAMGLYGVYQGVSEGVLRAYVADLVEDKSSLATAYGVYNTSIGLCMFPASFLMGILWQAFGPTVAFGFGASLAFLAAVGLLLFMKK